MMKYLEMTTEEAINYLKKSPSKVVMVAVKDLESDEDAVFFRKLKTDCEKMIADAQTVVSVCDHFISQMNLFTEKQRDIQNIEPHGIQKTILLKE